MKSKNLHLNQVTGVFQFILTRQRLLESCSVTHVTFLQVTVYVAGNARLMKELTSLKAIFTAVLVGISTHAHENLSTVSEDEGCTQS